MKYVLAAAMVLASSVSVCAGELKTRCLSLDNGATSWVRVNDESTDAYIMADTSDVPGSYSFKKKSGKDIMILDFPAKRSIIGLWDSSSIPQAMEGTMAEPNRKPIPIVCTKWKKAGDNPPQVDFVQRALLRGSANGA